MISVTRRTFVAAMLPVTAIAAIRKPTYADDVEFLLVELEKKAGHFFAAKKIDWAKVAAQFREEVKKVSDDVEHVRLCNRLVMRLRDGHAGLRDLKVKMPDETKGRRWMGPGVHLLVIGDKVVVRMANRGAEAAG